MKTQENKNFDPYRIIKPGDLYMMLSPEGKVKSVMEGDIMYENFHEFIYDAVYYLQKGRDAPYLNFSFITALRTVGMFHIGKGEIVMKHIIKGYLIR